jgi:oxygen-dependent protoporphyrinogen oxidase
MKSAIIIGGGISGLTFAWQLKQQGFERIRVLEKNPHAGGVIQSSVQDGYLVETGANEMLLKDVRVAQMLSQLGLDSEILEPAATAQRRFLVHQGSVQPLPQTPIEFFHTPLYSTRAKLRFFAEPFIGRYRGDADESLADFVTRRLGREFLDYGLDPLVSGIFAGDPGVLSMASAFPKVHQLEGKYGSLIRGAVAQVFLKKIGKMPVFRKRMITFRTGMRAIADALQRELGESVQTNVTVRSIESGWTVKWEQNGQSFQEGCDLLVSAVPAYTVSALPFPSDLQRATLFLRKMRYAPVSIVINGYDRSQVSHSLNGFGFLCPGKEHRDILGTLFSSSLFPNRAPAGKVSLMTFVGGMRRPENAALQPEIMQSLISSELEKLIGVTGAPDFTHHIYWPRAIPQYLIGHHQIEAQMDALEHQYPGLRLIGNYRGGVGVGDCMLSAALAAQGVLS